MLTAARAGASPVLSTRWASAKTRWRMRPTSSSIAGLICAAEVIPGATDNATSIDKEVGRIKDSALLKRVALCQRGFRAFNGEGEINAVKLLIDGIPSNSILGGFKLT